MQDDKLSHSELRRLLDYNPDTGILTWRVRAARRIKVGDPAGSCAHRGYLKVKVKCGQYLAHRLAWFWVHGEWPSLDVDHIDGNTSNNRLSNLRLATKSQNLANRGAPSVNTSGFKGVAARLGGGWRARIRVDGKNIELGTFYTPEEAHAAYIAAAVHHFGEFARAA